jgi:cbb3-type cytochrome oxidase maturation protein
MSVVFILVFVAIIMAGAFLVSFIWAVKSGQYDDTYTPSVRILFDDMLVKKEKEEKERVSDQSQLSASSRESGDGSPKYRSTKNP